MTTDPRNLSYLLLQQLEIVVLERKAFQTYALLGYAPLFYQSIFPNTAEGSACVEPWRYSEMLAFFLDDAEEFFACPGSKSSIDSGIWQEELEPGHDLPLVATAMCFGEAKFLIIRNLCKEFPLHQNVLQKARENLLQQSHLHRSVEFYKKKSSCDALTTLYNRGTFFDILQSVLLEHTNYLCPLTILLIDIDDFKLINDIHGHLAGDAVLRSLGQIFHDFLRKDDIAARYGGEEFIVCASNVSLQKAGGFADKIRKHIAAYNFVVVPNISVSIGVTQYQQGETLEECIKRADKALYAAKHAGKNRVRVFAG